MAAGYAARRAKRLVRLYPRAWRERYGEEFAELLVLEMTERPRSWYRSTDVLRGAAVARAGALGLSGPLVQTREQVGATLATLTWCLGVFLCFGLAMWSQLMLAWRWAAPARPATSSATAVVSIAVDAFVAIGFAAAAPIVWVVAKRLIMQKSQELWRPAAVVMIAGATLLVGGLHFAGAWPGSELHRSILVEGLLPGGLAAFSWASTLSVSPYWAHPSALAALPSTEIAWMALSPLAFACLIAGSTRLVRRASIPKRVIVFETTLARLASAAMVALLAGCCVWIADGGPGPGDLYRSGNLDLFGMCAMTAALAVGRIATQRACRLAAMAQS